MGGYGSTRWGWHTRRMTVSEAYALNVRRLAHHSLPREALTLPCQSETLTTYTWSNAHTGQPVAEIGLGFRNPDGESPRLI